MASSLHLPCSLLCRQREGDIPGVDTSGSFLLKIQRFITLRKWVKERRAEQGRCYLVISSRSSGLAQTELTCRKGGLGEKCSRKEGVGGALKPPPINFAQSPCVPRSTETHTAFTYQFFIHLTSPALVYVKESYKSVPWNSYVTLSTSLTFSDTGLMAATSWI